MKSVAKCFRTVQIAPNMLDKLVHRVGADFRERCDLASVFDKMHRVGDWLPAIGTEGERDITKKRVDYHYHKHRTKRWGGDVGAHLASRLGHPRKTRRWGRSIWFVISMRV